MAPRNKKSRVRETEQSSSQERQYPSTDFLSQHQEQEFSTMSSRTIIFGCRVNLAPKYDDLLISKLEAMGWANLVNLPKKVYPRLIALFYLHLQHSNVKEDNYTIDSYVKGNFIEFTIPDLAAILDVQQSPNQIYFQTDEQMAQIVGNINEVYSTICIRKTTGTNLIAKYLKPHLRILHRFIVENVTPKAGHFDVVSTFNAYLLYCFEVGQSIDLCYIIMREMALISSTRDKSLAFGALLTKILKHYKVRFTNEPETLIGADINEYTVNKAGGGDILLGSLPAHNAPMENPRDHHPDAMPPPQQPLPPAYWTDFMALKQERNNQQLQWEQQMSTQMANLGTQLEGFGQAQHSLIQQFGDFRMANELCHQELNTQIYRIENRIDGLYQHFYPPPPLGSEQ